MSSYTHPDSILLQDAVLSYRHLGAEQWCLPVSTVALIGEYTNANGPLLDDYFLVFVTADKQIYEASFYATGMRECHAQLELALGSPLPLGLANSASWNTRILWPPPGVGQPLFALTAIQPRGVWQHVLSRFGRPPTRTVLTPEAATLLTTTPRSA